MGHSGLTQLSKTTYFADFPPQQTNMMRFVLAIVMMTSVIAAGPVWDRYQRQRSYLRRGDPPQPNVLPMFTTCPEGTEVLGAVTRLLSLMPKFMSSTHFTEAKSIFMSAGNSFEDETAK